MTKQHTLDPDWAPEAVVFDCDGTLVDSERHWERARGVVLRGFGHAPGPEFAERSKGLHYTECGALMAEVIGRPDCAEELAEQLLAAYRALVARDPSPMSGARELVTVLSRTAPLAVASNCPADLVEFSLESVGLLHHFEHVVVPEGPIRPKPYPDTYAEAVRRLGSNGENALAVEDSVNGLRAAKRAGLRVVGVGARPSPDALDLSSLWVRDLEDPELMAWANGLPPAKRGRSGAAFEPSVPPPGGPPDTDADVLR
ncbi:MULTISPECIES: HAD family phosphatase [unclassified Streptomyces]|uniref:HAD family hydrolase n=1 Tax=unclassified Streptomyces TaxID=2593676 RepID=UPI0007DE1B14|nr:HAD family phosphatase [Streptomyces sp. SAT1]ANH89925.1 hydrolase [Streptomyces sp. SAT1]